MDPIFIIIGFVILLVVLIVGVVVSSNSERALVEQRLGQYLQDDQAEANQKDAQSAVSEWVNRRVAKSDQGNRIARDLARADMKLTVAEYFALIFISVIGVGFVGFFLGGFDKISGVIGMVLGSFMPPFYVRRQQAQRLRRFNDQLSDMLNLTVNGLRAGYSTMQALEAVSRELPSPIAEEFRRVVQEMQLGVTMDAALDNLLRRIPSEDLDFVVTAINVQREVGGNLSEILDTISFTIRERVRIKGEIRVMTSQVRLSGTAISLIPIGLSIYLWFTNRTYMMGLFLNGPFCGYLALITAAGLIATGYYVMMWIADIEV